MQRLLQALGAFFKKSFGAPVLGSPPGKDVWGLTVLYLDQDPLRATLMGQVYHALFLWRAKSESTCKTEDTQCLSIFGENIHIVTSLSGHSVKAGSPTGDWKPKTLTPMILRTTLDVSQEPGCPGQIPVFMIFLIWGFQKIYCIVLFFSLSEDMSCKFTCLH